MTICLTGFMGCGKSTVGKRTAEVLGCTFVDLDACISEMCGMDIPSIFSAYGEKYFREKEFLALQTLLSPDKDAEGNRVIALGGGTVTVPECLTEIRMHTTCIYLRAKAETLAGNLASCIGKRPLLNGCKDKNELSVRIREMLSERKEIYETAAHVIIDTDGKSPDQLAKEIASLQALLR